MKIETLKKKERKRIFFAFTLLHQKICFVRKHIWKNFVYIVTFALQFFYLAGY